MLVPGSERPRKTKLDLWDRFHVADGLVATLARLTVATGIIAAVLSVGTNGRRDARQHLQRARPTGDGVDRRELRQRSRVLARQTHGRQRRGLSRQRRHRARRADRAVRRLDPGRLRREHLQRRGRQHAGAMDCDLRIGRPGAGTHDRPGALDDERRGSHVRAAARDHQHRAQQRRRHARRDGSVRPRQSVGDCSRCCRIRSSRRKSSGRTRAGIRARVTTSAYWLSLASQGEEFDEIVRARLKLDPEDVLRCAPSRTRARDLRAAVCKRHRALANAHPDSINLQYVAARCVDNPAQQEQEFTALYAKAPNNGWVAAAMGYTHAEHGRWNEAMAALNVARQRVPAMTERFALDTMRLRRMSTRDGDAAGGISRNSPTRCATTSR